MIIKTGLEQRYAVITCLLLNEIFARPKSNYHAQIEGHECQTAEHKRELQLRAKHAGRNMERKQRVRAIESHQHEKAIAIDATKQDRESPQEEFARREAGDS